MPVGASGDTHQLELVTMRGNDTEGVFADRTSGAKEDYTFSARTGWKSGSSHERGRLCAMRLPFGKLGVGRCSLDSPKGLVNRNPDGASDIGAVLRRDEIATAIVTI